MIFILSASDSDMKAYAEMLAKEYNEDVAIFGEGCFRAMKDTDTSVYLDGHGNRDTYGDEKQTPEMLAAAMISYGLPKQVDKIYLVGCGIGEEKDGESFVSRFAAKLYAQGPEYRKIKIYYLNNLVSEDQFSEITVNYYPKVDFFEIEGMTPDQKKSFDLQLKKVMDSEPLMRLRQKYENLNNERVRILSEITDLKLKGFTETSPIIVEKRKQIPSKEEVDQHEKHYNELRRKILVDLHERHDKQTLYASKNIKSAMETNPNFQLTFEKMALLKELSSERKIAITLINTEIANLQHERSQQQAVTISMFSKLFNREPNMHIDYQILALERLRDVIQNKDSTEDAIKERLEIAFMDLYLITNKDILDRLERVRNALKIAENAEESKKLGGGKTRLI